MRGGHTATIKITGLAAAKTVLYITAPSTAVVEILEAAIENVGANVTNQQLEATLQRVSSLGTPTATTLTPAKDENGDQAAASTVKGNVTASEPTYAGNTEIGYSGFSTLSGYLFPLVTSPPGSIRVLIPPSGTIGLRMLSTPTSFDAICRMRFREIG